MKTTFVEFEPKGNTMGTLTPGYIRFGPSRWRSLAKETRGQKINYVSILTSDLELMGNPTYLSIETDAVNKAFRLIESQKGLRGQLRGKIRCYSVQPMIVTLPFGLYERLDDEDVPNVFVYREDINV